MSKDAAGSYGFSQFEEKQKELDRLKHQARAARQLELQVLKRCGLSSGMKTLDLACGPGVVSCVIAEIASPAPVLGIDLDPELLEQGKMLAADGNIDNLSFSQGNVYELDIEDDSYDFVYARFLFQHLEHSDKALAEIHRVVKPGGTVAIVDVDDDWLTLYPEPKYFRRFVRRAARNQQSYGGDRFVGRKLGYKLSQAGFEDINVNVDTVTSKQLGMKGFLDITTGYKVGQLKGKDRDIGLKEQRNIYQLLEQPDAWGFASVFVSTGKKPEHA